MAEQQPSRLTQAGSGRISEILAHLRAGHQIAIRTHTTTTVLGKSHVDYIRASEGGYQRGWTGRKKTFAFGYQVYFVAPGFRL